MENRTRGMETRNRLTWMTRDAGGGEEKTERDDTS